MKKAALLRPLLSWFLVRMPSPKPRQPRPDASDFCASLSESIFNRSIFSVRFHAQTNVLMPLFVPFSSENLSFLHFFVRNQPFI